MRAGYSHVLASPVADAYQRISPSSDTAVALARDCVALLLAAETATVFVSFDDTTASATNGLPIIAGAQPVYIPLGRNAHESNRIRAFSATGVLHIIQLS